MPSPLARALVAAITLAAAAPLLACGPAPIDAAAAVTTQLHVEGMVCGSCEEAIAAELAKVDGVLSARADHKAASVEVRHDPERASVDAIAAAIEKLGYTVVR